MRITRDRVLVATAGTLGDLLPFVALGRHLTSRGHEVVIACSTGLHLWVQRSGLKAVPYDGDFGMEVARRHARSWNHWGELDDSAFEARQQALGARIERNSGDLALLAREADLLLTPTNCPEGRLVHELTGTPWMSVIFAPAEGLLESGAVAGEALAPDPALSATMEGVRRRLGLPRRSWRSWEELARSTPSLFPCSSALGRTADPQIVQTGFWFYEDPGWSDWRPDPALMRFMEGPPPLLLSFSSLPLEDPGPVLREHVRAARLLGRRLVVQQGWAGFSRELLPADTKPEDVYIASFLPHDWFLRRCAVLITHGGAGSIGRALRNGCPLLVEPYGNDQFYNALLVKRLGYGCVMHPLRLTAESLAEVLQERLLPASARAPLVPAKACVQEEAGLERACALIERRLSTSRGAA